MDVHISFFSENDHQLYNDTSFIECINLLMATDSIILGAFHEYIGDKTRESLRLKYPESSQYCYNLMRLQKEYIARGFRPRFTKVGTILHTPNQYGFACHVDGDPLNIYYFNAQQTEHQVEN